MADHTATVDWDRQGSRFVDSRYSRAHDWLFDGGARVPASSSPHVVPLPMSDPAGVDPEEAFVAALSSCHMLWFLSLAAARGYTVDHYRDVATGQMATNDAGKPWIARVLLRPQVMFSGGRVPDDAAVQDLHHSAHAECFVANSVRTEVTTLGGWQHRA